MSTDKTEVHTVTSTEPSGKAADCLLQAMRWSIKSPGKAVALLAALFGLAGGYSAFAGQAYLISYALFQDVPLPTDFPVSTRVVFALVSVVVCFLAGFALLPMIAASAMANEEYKKLFGQEATGARLSAYVQLIGLPNYFVFALILSLAFGPGVLAISIGVALILFVILQYLIRSADSGLDPVAILPDLFLVNLATFVWLMLLMFVLLFPLQAYSPILADWIELVIIFTVPLGAMIVNFFLVTPIRLNLRKRLLAVGIVIGFFLALPLTGPLAGSAMKAALRVFELGGDVDVTVRLSKEQARAVGRPECSTQNCKVWLELKESKHYRLRFKEGGDVVSVAADDIALFAYGTALVPEAKDESE